MRTSWKHYGPLTPILRDPEYPRATFQGVRAFLAVPSPSDPTPCTLIRLSFLTGKTSNVLEFPPNVIIPVHCEPGEEVIIPSLGLRAFDAAGAWRNARLSVLSEDSE